MGQNGCMCGHVHKGDLLILPGCLIPRCHLLFVQEEARKALEAINAVMGHLGTAAVNLLSDPNRMGMAVAGFSAVVRRGARKWEAKGSGRKRERCSGKREVWVWGLGGGLRTYDCAS